MASGPSYEPIEIYSDCPTCRGSGKIRTHELEEYIALIPVNDHRLRPRRTLLKILSVIILLIIVFVLLSFFLYMRVLVLDMNKVTIIPYVVKADNLDVNLQFNLTFNATNNNYVPIKLTEVKATASSLASVISDRSLELDISIPSRQTLLVQVPLNATLKDYSYVCQLKSPGLHVQIFHFNILVSATILGQSSSTILEHYRPVSCFYNTSSSATLI